MVSEDVMSQAVRVVEEVVQAIEDEPGACMATQMEALVQSEELFRTVADILKALQAPQSTVH